MGLLFFSIGLLILAQQQDAGPDPADRPNPPAESQSVDGIVLDATTRVPIPGAHVTLHYQTSNAALREVTTEANGAFHLAIDRPGQYAVDAGKDGYLPASQKLSGDNTRPVTLALSSSIAIRGRIRAGETGDGLSGFTVSALRVTYSRGNREFAVDRTAFTDDQGDFRLEQLQPGDYFVEIKKFPPGAILQGRQQDSASEPAAPLRYPQTIWPGALDPDSIPLTASLPETDIGNVDLTKVKPGRIRGEVTGLDCASDGGYNVSVLQDFGQRIIEERDATITCGSAFTVSGLSPGNYAVRALVPGSIVTASLNLRIESVRINVKPLEEPVFIKRVIYNGAEVGTTFVPDAAPSIQTLQIVLSDQPSQLNGSVQEDGQPAANANVILSPWPLIANDAWAAAIVTQADSAGRFSFHGLRSGTYRVVCPGRADWGRRDMTGVLAGLLSAAEDVALADGESKLVVIK
jgi:hypothetical protein